MYWFSVPAIMKGWIDRVLTLGFAFSEEKRYSQGVFKVRHHIKVCILVQGFLPLNCWFSAQDKKAILSFTTGSLESMFSANGINGDMNVTLWPLQVLHQDKQAFTSWTHQMTNQPFLSAEWHPALLWLPGSGPSDLLGSISRTLRVARHHAGRLAYTTARSPGREPTVLHSSGLLWQGEGFPAEAWGLWETCH